MGDASKKAIYSVNSIVVDTVYTNAVFTLDREISLISEAAPFVQGEEVIVSFKILGDKGDKGDEGPPVNGGGMIPYEPFGITSAFTQYLFNNGQQKIVFNQFIPPTNGDYTHIKLYATNALNTSGYYTGSVGAAIYSHIDAPTLPGGTSSGYNAGNMNGYPYQLETSGVITLNNLNVQNTYLTIEFDQPFTVETDKLYWLAVGAYSSDRNGSNNQYQIYMLREQVNSNPPESPGFSRHVTLDSSRYFNPPSGGNPASFTATLGVPISSTPEYRDIASGLWFRLYNPNSAVGLGRRGPTGPQGPEGPEGPAVDGGGVIPYEPFSVLTPLGNFTPNIGTIYLNQFTAPTTGNYTHMSIFHGLDPDSNFQGTILAIIYTNLPDTRVDCDVGLPGTIVAYQIRTFTGGELGRKYIDFVFDTHAELNANTKYWVGFSRSGGGSFQIPYHSDYNQDNRLAVHSNTGFFTGQAPNLSFENPPTEQNSNYVFWYRLYNPNAAVGKGEKGDPGPQGPAGEDGSFGGATFDYTYNDTLTTNSIGPGEVRLNNNDGNQSTSNHMYLAWSDDNDIDINQFMNTIASNTTSAIKGFVRIQKKR